MKKPIFENEEEYVKLMTETCVYPISDGGMQECVRRAKFKGYIKKSIVKKAEELYKHYRDNGNSEAEIEDTIETLHDAVQFLRQRLKDAGK